MVNAGKKGKLGQLSKLDKEFDAQENLTKKASKKKSKKGPAKQPADLAAGQTGTDNILAELEDEPMAEAKNEEWKEFKFKCAKCRWGSDENEPFKEHYKSGWHKHNLQLLTKDNIQVGGEESAAITFETYQELSLMLQLQGK